MGGTYHQSPLFAYDPTVVHEEPVITPDERMARLAGRNRSQYDSDLLPSWLRRHIRVEPGACWVWTGSLMKGYGQVWVKSEGYDRWAEGSPVKRVHRLVYEILVRRPSDDESLDHLCLVKSCCNPADLEPVSHGENSRRGSRSVADGGTRILKAHCNRGHLIAAQRRPGTGGCRTCVRIIAYCKTHGLRHPDETGLYELTDYGLRATPIPRPNGRRQL